MGLSLQAEGAACAEGVQSHRQVRPQQVHLGQREALLD